MTIFGKKQLVYKNPFKMYSVSKSGHFENIILEKTIALDFEPALIIII